MTTSISSVAAGCATTLTHKWQEEVLLSDGSVVLVDRAVHYVPGHGEPFRSSKWIVGDEQLTLVGDATPPTVTWQGPPHRLAWYLDRRDGQFILIAYQTVCRAGDKQPVWRAYISSVAGWSEVPLTELKAAAVPNMALRAWSYKETAKWSRLGLADKSKFDYSRTAPEVKRIEPNSAWACL